VNTPSAGAGRQLFDRFAETLDQLSRIGSAYEKAPNVKL
jgi:hypothetical protein